MIRVENAADHHDALAAVGRWHWDEWGHADPNGSVESWVAAIRAKANRDRVPMTLLAFDGEDLVGAVSLVDHDMPDRADLAGLTPWIAGTFVASERRSEGVGSRLMERASGEAARLGLARIYLYTSTAETFYERLGWRREREDFYEGQPVTIMFLDIEPSAARR